MVSVIRPDESRCGKRLEEMWKRKYTKSCFWSWNEKEGDLLMKTVGTPERKYLAADILNQGEETRINTTLRFFILAGECETEWIGKMELFV